MHIKRNFLCVVLMMLMFGPLYAEPILSAPKDPEAAAQSCKQIALKLDWLSRYQDRPACVKNLDGVEAYIACEYILNRRYNDAEDILTRVLYQINFSIDTQCYGQDDLRDLSSRLGELIKTL